MRAARSMYLPVFYALSLLWTVFPALAICPLSTNSSSTDERLVSVNISDCAGATYFKLSESPTFKQTLAEGIQINIDNIAPDKTYADLSITYPNGVPGGAGTPYAVPAEQRTIKTLAVLFTFEDADGNIPAPSTYATTTFLDRLVFRGNAVGFDGYFTNYSIADHIYQSTNGRILLDGEVYPEIVRLPLESFRNFPNGITESMSGLILQAIEAANPGYLEANDFEYMLGFSPEMYAVHRNEWHYVGPSIEGLLHSIPIDVSSSGLAGTLEEERISHDAITVVTRFNPEQVESVRLASDTEQTGTNYFTGGKIKNTSTRFYYIELGTALPNANTAVVVRYTVKHGSSEESTQADQLIADGWFPHTMHELYHNISEMDKFKFDSERYNLGDLYNRPARVDHYDIMAYGDGSGPHPFYKGYYPEPSLL